MKYLISALLLSLNLSTWAWGQTTPAEELEAALALPPQALLRPWSLRLGAMSDFGLGVQLHDTLEIAQYWPGWDEQLEIFLQGSISRRALSIGGRYFLNPEDDVQVFLSARGGLNLMYMGVLPDGSLKRTADPWTLTPELILGLGLDWPWSPDIGLTASVNGGLPIFFYPELGIKYRF